MSDHHASLVAGHQTADSTSLEHHELGDLMSKYSYKVVPFIGKIKGKQNANTVAEQLQAVITDQASDGWEFYQLGEVNIEVSPGCLPALFGAKESYVKFDQLVFRRPS